MLKVIHAADFHLDSAFAALEPEKARQRRREGRELLGRLAGLVLEEQADLVFLAGDLFDGEQVYPETLEALFAALERMNCPVFIAPGNHDPYLPGSPYAAASWPENVHIFRDREITAVVLEELNCVIHGAAFTGMEREDQPLAGFSAPDDGRIHLMCIHGEIAAPDSRYGGIMREQIATSGLDYLALGHIHQFSGLQKEGSTFWAYPGCPEGRGFDELGEKGVLSVTVEKGSVHSQFIPLCRRRYRILRVDVTDRSPVQALEEMMPATAGEDICRVIFTGETSSDGVDLRAIEGSFAHRFYALQLRDETTIARDIWDRAEEDSLRGLFLQNLRQQYEAANTEEEREKITRAVRFGLAAMDGRDLG